MASRYVPDRGDIVWLQFDPQSGHEQAGRRPALVITPRSYNRMVGLALFCPLTSRIKNYPFEVALPKELDVDGVVLADQVKSLDWRTRKAKRFQVAPQGVMEEVLAKLRALLFTE